MDREGKVPQLTYFSPRFSQDVLHFNIFVYFKSTFLFSMVKKTAAEGMRFQIKITKFNVEGYPCFYFHAVS